MIFRVLQKLAVPRGMRLVRVFPVDDKLRQQAACEVQIDMRHAQNIVNIIAGLPVVDNALGLSAVFQAGAVARPLNANVLNEFGIQFFGRRTALTPVQDEFGNGLCDKVPGDAAALHDFHGIHAGSPVIVQRQRLPDLKLRLAGLLFPAPVVGDVLAKFVFPGVRSFAAFAPIKDEIFQLVQGKLPRYVVV